MKTALHFSDFEAYCDAIAHADLRMRVLGMEEPRYSIVQSVVGQLGLQWAREGSGQLSEGATDRTAMGLYMQLDSRPRLLNGMLIDPNAIVYLPPGSEFCFSCSNANSWFSVRVPLDLLGIVNGPQSVDLLDSISVVRPARETIRKFRAMVPAYLNALSDNPSLKNSAVASEIFQDSVLQIVRQICVGAVPVRAESEQTFADTKLRHDSIARMAADIVEDSLDGSQSIAGMAQRLDVSERTLLTAFTSRYGMTPRRFIHSMRLNHARALLREVEYPNTLVKDIAAKCGYWDYGRFAEKYLRLFGEYPAETATKGKPRPGQ